ncbi:MAG: hypothetical protein JRD93_17020 [Deltaproteobacteria bacterium]|nr:hypothetical protein [Deltaproteobacteria bacterium]MBW2663629.1 hypothetical protein [Deltaproteobacteria bacterium]
MALLNNCKDKGKNSRVDIFINQHMGIAGTDIRETNMSDETLEVRLIEEEFKRLMFDVEDL